MPRSGRGVGAAIALGVLALALVGVALWAGIAGSGASDEARRLRADADRQVAQARAATDGVDLANEALADPARTSEVTDRLRPVIEQVLSYDHLNLARTARAVGENLTSKALCEHEALFGEVKRLAPEQKITLTTTVREIGVSRLERDSAELLVFVDQRTTRADQNQTTASGAQFNLRVQRQDGRWMISEFDLLGQPFPNGESAPRC